MKVLVVEDDRKLARFLSRALTEEGYVVDTCSRGSDALNQASHIAYSLIVLDWMLPQHVENAIHAERRVVQDLAREIGDGRRLELLAASLADHQCMTPSGRARR